MQVAMPGRLSLSVVAFALAAFMNGSQAYADGTFRIGVVNDPLGTYADYSGASSVEAVKMAAEEVGGTVLGNPIEVLAGDHKNNVAKGVAIVTDWFDNQGVNAVFDVTNSSVALAVQAVAKAKGKIVVYSSPASTDLTGSACSPVGIQWTYDAYSQAYGTARDLVKAGKDTWYILAVEGAFGQSLADNITNAVQGSGGKVLGVSRHLLNASDFSQELMKAKDSGAKAIALANSGDDTVNGIKQAVLLGITGSNQTIVPMVMVISDIHYIGLDEAKDLIYLDGFYWDRDDDTRAWSKRFMARTGRMPGMIQAGAYSGALHYLKAVIAANTNDSLAVARKMRELPVSDMFAKNGIVREDGRMVHDMYLVKVKNPSGSKEPWDYETVLNTIPGNQAFRPLAESACPLVKK